MAHQDPEESPAEYDPLRHGSSPLSRWFQMPPPCPPYVAAQTQVLIHVQNIKHTNTHLHPRTQKSNTLRQLYLFSLSPWKCTGDQARARWTAYAFSTFLLPGQSNNIRPRWCSKVGPGPRSLSAGSTAGGGVLRGGEGSGESTRPVRWGLIPDPRAQYTFIIESDKVFAI